MRFLRIAVQIVFLCNAVMTAWGQFHVTAYYAGWMQGVNNKGWLPAEQIDFSALTHIIHFGLIPRPNGSIDTSSNGITKENCDALLSRAHKTGKKVLIAVGGRESDCNFLG